MGLSLFGTRLQTKVSLILANAAHRSLSRRFVEFQRSVTIQRQAQAHTQRQASGRTLWRSIFKTPLCMFYLEGDSQACGKSTVVSRGGTSCGDRNPLSQFFLSLFSPPFVLFIPSSTFRDVFFPHPTSSSFPYNLSVQRNIYQAVGYARTKNGIARVQRCTSSQSVKGGKKEGRIHGVGSGALLQRLRQFSRTPSTRTSDVTGAGFISLQASRE